MTKNVNIACRECGKPMVIRTNRENGSEFMGCSNWPRCTHSEPLPAYVEQIRAGAAQLPGFN